MGKTLNRPESTLQVKADKARDDELPCSCGRTHPNERKVRECEASHVFIEKRLPELVGKRARVPTLPGTHMERIFRISAFSVVKWSAEKERYICTLTLEPAISGRAVRTVDLSYEEYGRFSIQISRFTQGEGALHTDDQLTLAPEGGK